MARLLTIEEPGQTPLPHADEEIAVGIDLGTTNSLIAAIIDGEMKIIADENGLEIHPSIVAYKDGGFICGTAAQNEAEKIYSIKRLMGKNLADIAGQNNLPFTIADQENLKINLAGKNFTPTEISAEILKFLKNLAEKKMGKKVTKAVITVPAYFNEAARNDTKNAAILADLEVLRLINEPTAAAVAYGLDKEIEGIYAIFDLGGGTFDISILKLQTGIFKVIGVGGDAELGGDDFDQLLAEKIIAQNHLENLSINEIQQIKSIAKKIKEQFVSQDVARAEFELGNKKYQFSLEKNEFENFIKSLVEKTIKITTNLIDELDLEIAQIKGVVLVGGSTRLDLIRQKLREIFGAKILTDIDPDKVVAVGAAIQAEALTKGSANLLLDVIPLSLGIETMGGIVEKIIERNSTIPAAYSKEFTTYIDGQTGMKLHIVQGERETAEHCRSLANFEIKNIPPLKAGVARVKVTFTIDADGILTVAALEKTTGQIQTIEVKPSSGLSDLEIKNMLLESAKNSKKDIAERLLIEAKVEANRNILAIRAAIKEDADLIDDDELKIIENNIKNLEKLLAENNYASIKNQSEILENSIKDFAGKKMDKYIKQAITGKKIEEMD
jgi:molecular chaperone HscA